MLEVSFEHIPGWTGLDLNIPYYAEEKMEILYKLLLERLPEESISHKAMPTWEKHCEFVKSQPYKMWLLIKSNNKYVGAIYVSKNNEIGIGVLKEFRRKGYANAAIELLINKNPKYTEYIANINPQNEASITLFRKFGFKHIQNTYRRDVISQ